MKGKVSMPVYVYLVPKKKWPKKVVTQGWGGSQRVYMDCTKSENKVLGMEFLDCYGVTINGKNVSPTS